MRAGKIAGVELVINNWFILLFALFAAAGLVSKVLLVFSAVLCHELAHMLMAIGLGYKVKQVELLPFGAVARIEGIADAGAISEIMIAAAGPLASMALAVLCYIGIHEVSNWQDVCQFYGEVNLMLALFNLLPALPLDGGRILRAILSYRRDYRDATAIVVTVSYSIICILAILTGAGYWLYNTINLTMLVAALFLFITVRAEKNLAGFRAMRILASKKTELLGRQVMPTSHLTAMESAMLSDIIRLFGPEKYYIIHIIDQNFKLCGALTETEVWEGLVQKGIKSRINEFLR